MAEKFKNAANLEPMRHSLAHILAAAIQQLWPETKFGVGPVTEHGFYYDVDLDTNLTPDDLTKISSKMDELIKKDLPFEKFELPIDEAISKYKKEKQPYKVELLEDLKKHGTTSAAEISGQELGVAENVEKVTTVTFYRTGKFEDLCRGPHVKATGEAGAYKLTKVSGAYWRGSEKNPQLQRVYGVAFPTKKELEDYLHRLEEAERRDHRRLGQELDIFITSELVGAGLPLLTPKGTAVINEMIKFVREINEADGYSEVRTGHVTREELYEKSGHAEKFGDDLFVVEAGEDKLALKPMNCPHHIQLYARDLYSYRDLPIRYAEFSTLHRNEVKGALAGLTRVRALTQDDAHAFVREEQVEDEVRSILAQVDKVLSAYGLKFYVQLSLRDPENMKAYLGDKQIWDKAESMLEKLAGKFGMDYVKQAGEAAFYGPKMDFMAEDALGREWQVSTIQLDFNLPARFGISYVDENGDKRQPVLIHRALNGTFERMLGILIEHYGGKFPLWLAPEQVRLATVNDSTELSDYARKAAGEMRRQGLRVEIDLSNESVGKKIRASELGKVPYTIVIGEKELKTGRVTPRIRSGHGSENPEEMKLGELITALIHEAGSRAPKSSL